MFCFLANFMEFVGILSLNYKNATFLKQDGRMENKLKAFFLTI